MPPKKSPDGASLNNKRAMALKTCGDKDDENGNEIKSELRVGFYFLNNDLRWELHGLNDLQLPCGSAYEMLSVTQSCQKIGAIIIH